MTDERKARILFPDSKINTPKAHVHHTEADNCGCATKFEEVFFECRKCGAHYGSEPASFLRPWLCYDCGVHVELMPVEKEEG